MRMTIVIVALLAIQTSNQEFAKEVMVKAMAKSVADRQVLRERYRFDVVKNRKTSDEEGISDRLTIEELLGRGRYRYEMDDEIPISLNGRSVYLIGFFPEPDNQPDAPDSVSRREKIKNEILNHLRGLVYVDRNDLGIVRVVTHANSPPETIWKVGRLYSMEATFDQVQLGEIWIPKEITVKVEYSYFLGWGHHNGDTTIEFRNFRLKAP